MIDIKYYALLKAVEENHNTISNYTELRGINKKEDYENLWEDLIDKYNIDVHLYTTIRKYIVLVEAYFKDYDMSYLKRKMGQYKKNCHYTN